MQKSISDRWHGRPQRGAKQISPNLDIGYKDQKFLENLKSGAQFRSTDLILAMTIYLPVWHSHCTRFRFTVLVSCSDDMSLKVTHVRSLEWRGRLPYGRLPVEAGCVREDCSTVGLWSIITGVGNQRPVGRIRPAKHKSSGQQSLYIL